jgi:hypothetical protein
MSALDVILVPAGIIAALICFRWARTLAMLVIVASVLWFVACASRAGAQDSAQCAAPPYGDSVESYRAFIKDLGPLLDNPSKMLSGICMVKFGGTSRDALYNMGFTDGDIDTKSVGELGLQLMESLKNLVDKVPD